MLLWDGQSIESILRTGELAPGFTDGSAITALETFSISNAGAVFLGTVGAFLTPAIWHWDGMEVELVSSFSGLGVDLPVDQNGCEISITFGIGGLQAPLINNNGIIAFNAILSQSEQTTDTDLCRGTAVVQYDGSAFTTIVKTRDIVPSTETAIFTSVVLNALFDSGSMSITAVLTDDNATGVDTGRFSTWIFRQDGTADLLAIIEETVPPGFVDRFTLFSSTPIVIAASDDLAVQLGLTSLGTTMLSGAPHSGMPYPDIGAVGASSMSFVASTNSDAPPGLPANTFISSFSRPAIDRSGRVYYRATIEQTEPNTQLQAFYIASPQQDPVILLDNSSEVMFEGESRQINSIEFQDAVTLSFIVNNSAGVRVSQQGHALVPVVLDEVGGAILHVTAR